MILLKKIMTSQIQDFSFNLPVIATQDNSDKLKGITQKLIKETEIAKDKYSLFANVIS